jgi:hypothetical protein
VRRPELGDISGRREDFIRAAEACFAKAILLVPRRYRFAAAVLAARAAVPFFRMTDAYRVQERLGFDSPHEIALHFILNALTRSGTRFDPVIAMDCYEELERAYAAGKGVLMIAPHAALTMLMPRLLYDRGLDSVVVTPDARMRIGGTRVAARTVQPSPTFLVKTRSSLRRGEIVLAMPDRAEHHRDRTVEFTTAKEPIIVAPALMRVAARCGAAVLFMELHAGPAGLEGTIASTPPASAGDADAITEEFVKFVWARAKALSTSRGETRAAPPQRGLRKKAEGAGRVIH